MYSFIYQDEQELNTVLLYQQQPLPFTGILRDALELALIFYDSINVLYAILINHFCARTMQYYIKMISSVEIIIRTVENNF